MSLIDKTYFTGEINIPGLQSSDNVASLQLFIDKYEKRYLQEALGYSLWKLFNAAIDPGPADGRFASLQEGAEFTDRAGNTKNWTGFTNSDLESPIANYVYYWYTRDQTTFTSTVGEVKTGAENSSGVSPAVKQMRAYNEMVDQTRLLREYLKCSKDEDGNPLFPEFSECHAERFDKIMFI